MRQKIILFLIPVFLLVIILIFFIFLPEMREWNKAKAVNSIKSYEAFIDKYPNGIHVTQAKRGIEKLQFQQLLSAKTIDGFKDYLAKYPNGIHADKAKQLIENLYFRQAILEDKISLYRVYLEQYPQGRFADKAMDAIRRIEEDRPVTIIDSQGNTYHVKGLRLNYYDTSKELYFRIVQKDGKYSQERIDSDLSSSLAFRITVYTLDSQSQSVKERVEVPFREIKQIDFTTDELSSDSRSIHIEKKDGSSLLISERSSSGLLTEKDSNGKITKVTKLSKVAYSTFIGNSIMSGFEGQIVGDSGNEEHFSISWKKVRCIKFMDIPLE